MIEADPARLAAFWTAARQDHPHLPAELPSAWAFGATPEHADGLLALVLAGIKTGTASSRWDYDFDGDPLPKTGELSIILDGRGAPSALIETLEVRTVPFDQVTEEHAFAEGEDDRTLASWRSIHERFWREHATSPRGFAPDMPVVCERFRLIHPV